MPTAYFQAVPGMYGAFETLLNHLGEPNKYSISYRPTGGGGTVVVGKVRYWTEANEQIEKEFLDSIVVPVGRCVCSVELCFKGVPFGSPVETTY